MRVPSTELNRDQLEAFTRHVTFMKWNRHPHIVNFLGGGVDSRDRAFLASELMMKGSLRQCLNDEYLSDWRPRIQIAIDIAQEIQSVSTFRLTFSWRDDLLFRTHSHSVYVSCLSTNPSVPSPLPVGVA